MASLRLHLVECSPALKTLQYQNLKCTTEDAADGDPGERCISTLSGSPVSWHAMLDQVPTGGKEFLFYDSWFCFCINLYGRMIMEEKCFL